MVRAKEKNNNYKKQENYDESKKTMTANTNLVTAPGGIVGAGNYKIIETSECIE